MCPENSKCPENEGAPVLCDFGPAILGGKDHLEVHSTQYLSTTGGDSESPMDVQRRYMECGVYGKVNRLLLLAREFLTLASQILDIFEGDSLFTGQDPEFQTYRSRAHIAEMISLLGPPPPRLLAEGRLSHNFFSDKGKSSFFYYSVNSCIH